MIIAIITLLISSSAFDVAGLLLDKDGCEVSSFGTSLPMFGVPAAPIREVLILLGGPHGIHAAELQKLMDIFSGFSSGLMKIRLPGGLHHSCVALNDLLSFHDKGAGVSISAETSRGSPA